MQQLFEYFFKTHIKRVSDGYIVKKIIELVNEYTS